MGRLQDDAYLIGLMMAGSLPAETPREGVAESEKAERQKNGGIVK